MDTGDLNLPAYKYQLEQVENSFRLIKTRHLHCLFTSFSGWIGIES